MVKKAVPKKPAHKKTAAKKSAPKTSASAKSRRGPDTSTRYVTEMQLRIMVETGAVHTAVFRSTANATTGARWRLTITLPARTESDQPKDAVLSTARGKSVRYFNEGAAVRLAERLGLPTACFDVASRARS